MTAPAHARRVIREAVVTLLKAAATTAGDRVFDNPTDPRIAWPSVVVRDEEELQETRTLPFDRSRPIQRRMRLCMYCEVVQKSGYAAARDDLCGEVEAALAAAAIPGVKAIAPTGFRTYEGTTTEQHTQRELPICVGEQHFEILYFTPQGTPSTFS